MTFRLLIAAALLVLCSGASFSQDPSLAGALRSIDGARILDDRSYDGRSLWGYIDGGADLYLEYGFRNVRAIKLGVDSIRYQIDCYRMNDPESAYGIYSVSSYACGTDDSLPQPHCLSRYQIQFVRGDWYVSIADNKGTARSAAIGMSIARALARQIAPSAFELPKVFSLEPFRAQRERTKFMRGTLGIQNGYAGWEDRLGDAKSYALYLLPLETNHGDCTIAQLSFNDPAQQGAVGSRFGLPFTGDAARFQQRTVGGILRCAWRLSPSAFILLETTMPESDALPFVNAISAFVP